MIRWLHILWQFHGDIGPTNEMKVRRGGIGLALFGIQPYAMCLCIVLRLPSQIIGRSVIRPAAIICRHPKQDRTPQNRDSKHPLNKPDKIVIT